MDYEYLEKYFNVKKLVEAEGFIVALLELTPEANERLKLALDIDLDPKEFLGMPVVVRDDIPENLVLIVRKVDWEERNRGR